MKAIPDEEWACPICEAMITSHGIDDRIFRVIKKDYGDGGYNLINGALTIELIIEIEKIGRFTAAHKLLFDQANRKIISYCHHILFELICDI